MTPVQLPEVPAHIGLIVGVRLTPANTNEFYGYFEPSYRGLEKERVYTAAQLREYATEAVMAERVRMAAEVESLASEWSADEPDMADPPQFYFVRFKHQCAARIRALITPSETNSER